ncbi:hypothetical protein IEQ34_021222 [Dendrobium chrysotoxum]|uniref:Glucan endo-1,3-beta-D-glucosidase n=1 Tax=Dendrobium chrysotoxum TaxID=161865 RepID=A0AAV7G454_DENCH|nr:hypothetical protein IEQ34_021222 [Dendrobium chrysotoxum]
MAAADLNPALALLILLLVGFLLQAEADIGVNWGILSTHRLSPPIVVDLMKENRIGKVKLFDTDPSILRALMGSNIEVMVGNPNEMLELLSSSPVTADVWVSQNVSRYVVEGGVKMRWHNIYYNAFDGNFDTLVAALNRIDYGQMPIVIGEVGWPTDGAFSANLSAARAFKQGLINHLLSNKGTSLRPGVPPTYVFLFSLLDEEQKSTLPGNFE